MNTSHRKTFLAGLSVLLLALLTVLLLPATTAGSRWLLAQVPGLAVEGFDGRILGNWHAQRLFWQQEGAPQVLLEDVRMTTDSGCLLQGKLCVEKLQARRLDLHLSDAGSEAGNAALPLPAIRLPFLALELSCLQLGHLSVQRNELLSNLELHARWHGNQLVVERLRAWRQGQPIGFSAQLQMQEDWPLAATMQLALPAPGEEAWQLALTAKGALMGQIRIQGQSRGWLDAQMEGRVNPLERHLPLGLQIKGKQLSLAGLAEHLLVKNLQVNVTGDLQAGYRLEAAARLPAGALSAHLQGLAFAYGAKIDRFQLLADDAGSLGLSAALDWQEGMTAQLDLEAQDFPWPLLYPDARTLPLELRQIKADARYADGRYQGRFAAHLAGAAADVDLSSPFDGNLEQITFQDLRLETGAGGAQGTLEMNFAETLAWQLALVLQNLNPAFWHDELPGQLSGRLDSEGAMKNGEVQGSASFGLDGTLRGQNARLLAEGSGTGSHWDLQRLDLQLGDNRLQGKAGSAGEQLQADLTLVLPRPGQLWPELSGSASGQIQLHGSWLQPQGNLHLSAQKLAFAGESIGRLDIKGKFLKDNATLQLLAADIDGGGQRFSRFELSAHQQAMQQQVQGQLSGDSLQATFDLSGEYQPLEHGWQWLGDINKLRFAAYGQNWQLRAPARLARLSDGKLNLAAHCLQNAGASLCSESIQLLPQPRLDYRLQDFELASLAPWLAENLALDGRLFAELSLDLADGPNALLHLTSADGRLRVQEQEQEQGQWLDFPWQHLRFAGQMDGHRMDGKLDWKSAAFGNLSAQVQLDAGAKEKPVNGKWQLDGLDLALMQPLIPQLSRLRGQVHAQGTLHGDLLSPQIEADIALRRGEISAPDVPFPLHQLELNAHVQGEQMKLSGDWVSGRQGRGKLAGQLSWQQGLSGRFALKGEKWPVSLPPYAELQVFPDLTLLLAEGRPSISGTIKVPSGQIEIHSLASSVVRPSGDAVVLGRQTRAKRQQDIGMNILLSVGDEGVSFNGFGLQAKLVGTLRVGDNASTQGELDLRGGRYRSYGQNLKVRRARLLFTGSLQQPFIDIEAVRVIDSVTAGLRISGLLEQPQTRIFAKPTMSDEQALSWLVLGKPLGSNDGSNSMLEQAALGLGLAGGEALGGRLGEHVGLRHFELTSKGTGDNTQVVVSGTLANRLSLSYGVGLFSPQGTIALRYKLGRSLYLEAASSLANSLDLLYRRDF